MDKVELESFKSEVKGLVEYAESSQLGILALMKLIATFPWLAEVADEGYDPIKANAILIREADRLKP